MRRGNRIKQDQDEQTGTQSPSSFQRARQPESRLTSKKGLSVGKRGLSVLDGCRSCQTLLLLPFGMVLIVRVRRSAWVSDASAVLNLACLKVGTILLTHVGSLATKLLQRADSVHYCMVLSDSLVFTSLTSSAFWLLFTACICNALDDLCQCTLGRDAALLL